METRLRLKEGQETVFSKMAVNHWEQTEEAERVWSEGLALARELSGVGFDQALSEQRLGWARFWSRMDIEIDGDPEMQQGVRYSLFAMYINYHGESDRRNVLCKLGGEVYSGVNFWDTEVYCHRMYMFLDPMIARKLLMYRYHYLPRALENAKRIDLEGARYPFSTITGYEDSGTWQHVDLEIHQNGAIYYAIWHYDRVCKDKDFLYREGIEMLLQMCRCMASAGGWSPKRGDFGFYGVMGPDEFHMMVNNNCYTNYLGKKMFEYTLDVLAEMERAAPELRRQVVAKVGLRPEEPAEWKRMAEKMRIPKDEETGIYEQHDGYFDLPHVDVKSHPDVPGPDLQELGLHQDLPPRYAQAARLPQPAVLLQPGLHDGGEAEELRVLRGANEPRVLALALPARDPRRGARQVAGGLRLSRLRGQARLGQLQPQHGAGHPLLLGGRSMGQHGLGLRRPSGPTPRRSSSIHRYRRNGRPTASRSSTRARSCRSRSTAARPASKSSKAKTSRRGSMAESSKSRRKA